MNLIFLPIIYILILYSIIFISKKLNLYDYPSNNRKIHLKRTLNTSGLALYIYLFIIVSKYEFSYQLEGIILIGLFVALSGFVDDQKGLSPGIKLTLLLVPGLYLIFNGYVLKDLGEYEYLGVINLGKFSIIFTILAYSLLVNSYNYIDGIDGLLLCTVTIGICYAIFLSQNQNTIEFLKICLIPIVINIYFNFLPSKNSLKIFGGDCGSLFLGYFISFLMIYLYIIEKIHPAYLIWICWYPVYDFLFLTTYRIKTKKNLFLADNNHLHHILLKNYFYKSHLKTTMFICSLNIAIIILNYNMIYYFGKIYSLVLFFILFIIYFLFRDTQLKKIKI
jgi:UDP-GlcNAc:undecaprenyl-phosphate GlcNAc-1-phosphate transferase